MSGLRRLFPTILLVFSSATFAVAATWEEEIQQAQRLAKEYHEKATARGVAYCRWDDVQ
jgi:hypothetical protein